MPEEVCVRHKYYRKNDCDICAGHALQMELDLEHSTNETDEWYISYGDSLDLTDGEPDGNPTDR